MTTLKLRTPIKHGSRELTELAFRKPNGGDARRCGLPTKVEATPTGGQIHHVDTEAVARLISALCEVPPSTVDEMDAADFTDAVPILVGFFNTPAATSSAAAGNSPDSTGQDQTLSN